MKPLDPAQDRRGRRRNGEAETGDVEPASFLMTGIQRQQHRPTHIHAATLGELRCDRPLGAQEPAGEVDEILLRERRRTELRRAPRTIVARIA